MKGADKIVFQKENSSFLEWTFCWEPNQPKRSCKERGVAPFGGQRNRESKETRMTEQKTNQSRNGVLENQREIGEYGQPNV